MGNIYKMISNRKLLKLSLCLILFVGAAVVYFNFFRSEHNNLFVLSEGQEIHDVALGDVRRQVSITGRLVFPGKETLNFGSQGIVAEILVTEGQLVTEGDIVAKLDMLTIRGLERDLAKSARDLQVAEESLESGQEGTSGLDHSQLEEMLAQAALEVQESEEKLDEAKDPYPIDVVSSAEQALLDARIFLRDRVYDLEKQDADHALSYAKLVKDKHAAEVTVREATEILDQLDTEHAELLAETTQSRNELEISVETATKELKSYKERKPLWSQWIEEKDTALVDLRYGQDKLDHLYSIKDEMPGLDHIIVHWEFVVPIRREAYDDARAKLFELERLKSNLSLEQTRLNAANEWLKDLLIGVDSVERTNLLSSVQLAQADLSVATKSLANQQVDITTLNKALLEVAVKDSSAQVTLLEENLNEMLTGADPITVALREKQLDLAKAKFMDAEVNLSDALIEPDRLEIDLLKSDVKVAVESLRDANKRLEDATLRMPFSGIISELYVEVGDLVGPNEPVLDIADPTTTEIEGLIDEIDILLIRVGSKVDLMLDSMPTRQLQGSVTTIAPTPEIEQTVVSYPVSVSVSFPPRLTPREGLSAVANIIIQEEEDVLRIPQQGLTGSFDKPLVRVKTSEGFEDRSVSLGSTDGYWVTIRDGLNEGEQIIVQNTAANTSQFNFRQLRGQFGGPGQGNSHRPQGSRRGGGSR